jgi:peptidoglycan/xylan/chitin deacetylase (PgdA/CDA1 family)
MVRAQVRHALDLMLARSPAQSLLMNSRTDRLAALAYHGIDDPASFERHLNLLARIANPISLDQLLDAASGRTGLPPNPVLITFDDGQRSVLEVGLPLLMARGLPGLVFVVAGLLDSDEPYWWVEVEERVAAGGAVDGRAVPSSAELVHELKRVPDERRVAVIDELRNTTRGLEVRVPQLRRSELPGMESSGVAIGSHSMGHRCLSRCSTERINREITDAHSILTEALGHPPRSFAYPDGVGDGRVRAALASTGYEAAFLFDHRLSALPLADTLRISRVRVNSTTDLDRLSIILSGLHPAIHHLMGRE